MKTTRQGHVWTRHVAVSLVTGNAIEFFERVEPEEPRGKIIRRILGWPTKGATMYPSTDGDARPDGDSARSG